MEKYRRLDNLKMPFWLTQQKHYIGLAWYQKDIIIPANWKNKHISLYLEHPHFITRVWVDDIEIGTLNSLTVPHVYSLPATLKKGKHRLTVRIDNRMKDIDVGSNSHSVTDHTQGNWNGMVGKLELTTKPLIYFEDIQVFPDLKLKRALVKIKINSDLKKNKELKINLSAKSFNSPVSHSVVPKDTMIRVSAKETAVQMVLPMGDDFLTWDEFSPALYKLTATLQYGKEQEQKQVDFGMREITIEGKWFYVNGVQTMMRGTVENALFPLTGYPPMDVESWERVFRICRSYGLNHMRFHSYCPPEAAFVAADKIGFYLQPEGPSWPNHSTQLGRGLPIDKYLMDETIRMTKEYGNHPSFSMMACGNEPRGAWVPWVSKFVDYWKAADKRRIYTGASVGQGWAWQPKSQFHVKAGARGLNWNNNIPESMTDYRSRIDSIKQPYISHETGQWCAFPDFDEIKQYTGVNKAKNFELFQEDLADNDMGGLGHEFMMASGHLQTLCYKHEIERTLRTPDYAGFQLLSLNDYSGQGTALVGVLNAMWQEKGYTNAKEFSQFCNSTVPLIRTKRFVYYSTDTLVAQVEVAHFEKEILKNAVTLWQLTDKNGKVLKSGQFAAKDLPVGNNISLGALQILLTDVQMPSKLNLQVSIAGTSFKNNWDFWVYPAKKEKPQTTGIYIATEMDAKAQAELDKGGKVLLLAAGKIQYGKDVVQYYTPVFWNTSWFKMRPPHTTGVYIRNSHPVFQDFVTENWGNMQWWELVNRTQCMLLADFPKGFQPIVQPIDTWFVNRKLGLLFEAKVGKGKLVMTTMDLLSNPKERPVADCMYRSIINYMQSPQFNPKGEVDKQQIQDLFVKVAAPINSYTKSSPDELKKDVK